MRRVRRMRRGSEFTAWRFEACTSYGRGGAAVASSAALAVTIILLFLVHPPGPPLRRTRVHRLQQHVSSPHATHTAKQAPGSGTHARGLHDARNPG